MKKIYISLTFLSLFLIPSLVYASPPRINQLGGILTNVMNILTPIGVFIATAMIVYAGYMLMISGGDSAKI